MKARRSTIPNLAFARTWRTGTVDHFRSIAFVWGLALLLFLPCEQASAQSDLLAGLEEPYPLRAADTSSPRDTLRSFMRDFSEAVDAWRSGKSQAEILRPLERAADTFDLSEVAALQREATVLIDMALLREVLDRVQLPPYENIPGDREVAEDDDLTHWVVPNTKIEIVKIADGPRAGQFLFSKETVDKIPDYYALAKEIPYKAGAIVGIYEEVLASPGQWMPQHFPDALPAWATAIVGGQGIWQWIALAVLAIVALALFRLLIRLGIDWDSARAERSSWLRFGLPGALILVLLLSEGFGLVAENVIGLLQLPLTLVSYAVLTIQLIAGSWFVFSLAGRLADAIGQTSHRSDGRHRFDTALMRILFRLVSFIVIAMFAIVAAEEIGIPIAPLVAGLGVGGLAIALAVRPTLENIIGGLTLFADRPVRVGDFCRYGDNIGTVEEIGLRSTRIRTLENSLVSIPNSEFSQMHLDNYEVRYTRLLRTVLQLRYETTPDQMRYVLAKLRELLVRHPMVMPEPARVRFVGYGAYSKDVEVFAYLRCQSQNTFLAIQEDILLRMEDVVAEAGTGFAFPSQTAYLARDGGVDSDKARAAEAEVADWRDESLLPFPEFEPGRKAEIEDTLDYPPKGAHDAPTPDPSNPASHPQTR